MKCLASFSLNPRNTALLPQVPTPPHLLQLPGIPLLPVHTQSMPLLAYLSDNLQTISWKKTGISMIRYHSLLLLTTLPKHEWKWSRLTVADYTCNNISHSMCFFLQSYLNIPSMGVVPLEHALTVQAMLWDFVRPDDKNATHFLFVLLGRALSEYSCRTGRKPTPNPWRKTTERSNLLSWGPRHRTKGHTFPTMPSCLNFWPTESWA